MPLRTFRIVDLSERRRVHERRAIKVDVKPHRTTRSAARLVWCPRCGAAAGSSCVSERVRVTNPGCDDVERRDRISCHQERHELAIKLGAKVVHPKPQQG
jgi:hypothetical protein